MTKLRAGVAKRNIEVMTNNGLTSYLYVAINYLDEFKKNGAKS